MTITTGTKTVLDASSVNIIVKTINDSSDSTTSPAHGIIDGSTGALVSPATQATLASVLTAVQAATPAGTNLIGKVGLDQTTPGTTNQVVEYTIPVTASASFTRPATAPTFASGQLLANSATAGSVTANPTAIARTNDQKGRITGLILKNSSNVITNAIFRVHLLKSFGGVSNGDTGTYTLTNSADSLGYFDVTMSEIHADGSIGFGIPMNGGPFVNFTPLSGTQNVDWLIEARAAYVGVSGQTFTVTLVTE